MVGDRETWKSDKGFNHAKLVQLSLGGGGGDSTY